MREYPLSRKNTPAAIPRTKPAKPESAFRSPPARRSIMRKGQPRNTRQPSMTKNPRTKRVMGALPPLGRNSPLARAKSRLPRTSPMISGRMYWTLAAEWSPSAPAVSRRKQAMQKPIFTGLPRSTRRAARTPMRAPAARIVIFSFFISDKIPPDIRSCAAIPDCCAYPYYTNLPEEAPIIFINYFDRII